MRSTSQRSLPPARVAASARRLSLSHEGRGGSSSRLHVRRGFTLVELLVAMSIFLVLSFITIGALRLGLTGEGVRTAARLVQSKLEGARDRAIYNSKETAGQARPVGVRLLVDPNEPTICRSLVYVESAGRDESNVAGGKFVQLKRVGSNDVSLLSSGASWPALYDRGLIGPGTIAYVYDTGGNGPYPLTFHPDEFANGISDEIRVLWDDGTPPHPTPVGATPGDTTIAIKYYIELNPDVMADEEVLELPQSVCIDLETSHLPDGWRVGINPTTNKATYSNRMDILFSAQGPCVGEAAAAGIMHLHMVDVDDALEDTLPGSPTTPNDFDGDGNPDDRHGNELGLTIFTKAGRVITHPMGTDAAYPTGWTSTSYAVGNQVSPTIYNGLIFTAISISGTGMSGVTEPDWNSVPGGLTSDNQVTWLGVKHDVWGYGLQGEVAR